MSSVHDPFALARPIWQALGTACGSNVFVNRDLIGPKYANMLASAHAMRIVNPALAQLSEELAGVFFAAAIGPSNNRKCDLIDPAANC